MQNDNLKLKIHPNPPFPKEVVRVFPLKKGVRGILIAVLTFAFLFLNLSIANAAIVPCGYGSLPDCNVCHLFIGIGNIVTFATENVALPVAVVVIMWGGFLWITAGGEEKKITDGQKAIKQAIIGLLVTFAAWLIIDTILRVLITGGLGGGTAKIVNWGPWNEFPSCN